MTWLFSPVPAGVYVLSIHRASLAVIYCVVPLYLFFLEMPVRRLKVEKLSLNQPVCDIFAPELCGVLGSPLEGLITPHSSCSFSACWSVREGHFFSVFRNGLGVLEEESAWINPLPGLSILVLCHLYLMTLLHTRCPLATPCVCSCLGSFPHKG